MDIAFDELKIAAARVAQRYSWKYVRQYDVQPLDIEAHKAIFAACHKRAMAVMWKRLEARGHAIVDRKGPHRPTTQRHIDRFTNMLVRTIEEASDRMATRH